MVPKPDSSYHFCTDYHKVNRVTKADSFPLRWVVDSVGRVGSATFASKLDLLRASGKSLSLPMPLKFLRLWYQITLCSTRFYEVYIDVVCSSAVRGKNMLKCKESVFSKLTADLLTLNADNCVLHELKEINLGPWLFTSFWCKEEPVV